MGPRNETALHSAEPPAGHFMPAVGQSVTIQEVGLRDGLQLVEFVSTQHKVALIHELVHVGTEILQVTSFVNPRALPQFSDAEEVAAALPRGSATRFSALIPNLRGAERAAGFGLDIWELMYSVTDAHSHRNAGRSAAQAMSELGLGPAELASLREQGVI